MIVVTIDLNEIKRQVAKDVFYDELAKTLYVLYGL
jgi:hypothetical protein